MPQRPFQTSFSSGEWDPLLSAHVDAQKYASSCKTLENFMVVPQGPVTRRPGTRFVGALTNGEARLVPFVFSTGDAYILAFDTAGIGVYKDGGMVTLGAATHGFTLTQIKEMRFAQSADMMWLVHNDFPPKTLTRTSDTVWILADAEHKYGPFQPENPDKNILLDPSGTAGAITVVVKNSSGTPITAGNPFTTPEALGEWKLRHANGTHGISYGYFTVTGITTNTTGVTMGGSVNKYTDELDPNTDRGLAGSTASYMWSAPAWSAKNATTGSGQGYPSVVGFFAERLWFGSTIDEPTTLWSTMVNQFNNFFEGGGEANKAINVTLAGNQLNTIYWLSPFQDMVVGMDGGEFIVTGGSDSAIAPDNTAQQQQSSHGSLKEVDCVQVDNLTLFAQKGGRKIREMTYTFDQRNYVATDLTYFAKHTTASGIAAMGWADEPYRTLYCVLNDGKMATMCYDRTQEVLGFARQVTDGEAESLAVIPHPTEADDQIWIAVKRTLTSGDVRYIEYFDPNCHTDSAIMGSAGVAIGMASIAFAGYSSGQPYWYANYWFGAGVTTGYSVGVGISVVGVPDNYYNGTYGVAQSLASGELIRVVRYDDPEMTKTITGRGYVALISGGSAKKEWDGLSHLLGKTVDVLGDGAVMPRVVVAGTGGVTLGTSVSRVEIGLPFTSTLTTQPPAVQVESGRGTAAGRPKRWAEVSVRFNETVGFTIVHTDGTEERIGFRSTGDNLGEPVPPFTGDKRISLLGIDREGSITIKQTQPLPCTILGIYGSLDVPEE